MRNLRLLHSHRYIFAEVAYCPIIPSLILNSNLPDNNINGNLAQLKI